MTWKATATAKGAILLWDFQDTSGTTAVEAIGGRNGTYTGSAGVDYKLNQAGPQTGMVCVDFPTGAGYVTLTDAVLTNSGAIPNNRGTGQHMSFEIILQDEAPADHQYILSKFNGSNLGWAIGTGSASTDLRHIWDDATVGLEYYVANITWDAAWHHWVFVIDVVGGVTHYISYRDGSPYDDNGKGSAFTLGPDTASPLRMMAYSGGTANNFPGKLAGVAIYNASLSSADVATLYAAYNQPQSGGQTANPSAIASTVNLGTATVSGGIRTISPAAIASTVAFGSTPAVTSPSSLAPTFRNQWTYQSSATITPPAGHTVTLAPTANRTLIAYVSASALISSVSAGWTAVQAATVGHTAVQAFWKIADGTETSFVCVLAAAASCAIAVREYSGTPGSSPIDQFAAAQTLANTRDTTAGTTLTTALADEIVTGYWSNPDDQTTTVLSFTPNAFAQVADLWGTSFSQGSRLVVAETTVNAAGTQTVSAHWTVVGVDNTSAQILTIKGRSGASDQQLDQTAIGSTVTFGAPSFASTSNQTVNPSAIASTVSLAAPVVLAHGAATKWLKEDGAPWLLENGAYWLLDLTQQAAPSAIASTFQFSAVTVTPGDMTANPTAIASTTSIGVAGVSLTPTGDQTLTPTAIGSTVTVGVPTVTQGQVQVSATTIATTTAFGTPTFTPGEAIISPDPISPVITVGHPTFLGGRQPNWTWRTGDTFVRWAAGISRKV